MPAISETFERSAELARITAALDDAAAGNGRVVVIEGEAGIGKTHLVRATRDLAKERGFGRLQAIGDELETAMAWGVVRQMVERSVSRYSGEIRDAILAGPTGKALEALETAPMTPGAGDAEVARTLHGLWWVAVDLSSTRPLLITVDDAQWSDLPSIRFLNYLSRRIADLPIALVVGTRPPADQSGPLAELSVARHIDRLLPGPLSEESVAGLGALRGAAPAPEVVAAVHHSCGGNPFLAGALLDELTLSGRAIDDPATAQHVGEMAPATVSRALLARLPDDAARLAGALAVLGTRTDPWLAAQVAGLSPEELAAPVDALVAGNVAVADSDKLDFTHPVIREAMLASLGPVEQATLHAAAARALIGDRTPADRVAVHLAAAPKGTVPEAARIFREAAALSRAAGDADTAADYLARAFDESPSDTELEAELGFALLDAGNPTGARTHLRAAAAASDVRRAQLLGAAAAATAAIDGPAAAVRELAGHLADWPETGRDPARLSLEARLGVIRSFLPEERRAAGQHLWSFSDLPGKTVDERTLLALLAQSGRYDGSDHATVGHVAARALANGALFDDGQSSVEGMIGWVLATMASVASERIDVARDEIGRAQRRVAESGSPLDYAMVNSASTFLEWRVGNVLATEADIEAVLEAVALEDPSPHVISMRASAAQFGAYAAFERRDRDRARALVARFDESCAGAPVVISTLWLREVRARIHLGLEEPEKALVEAYALRDAMADNGLASPLVPWRVPAAFAELRLGRPEVARELADESLELAKIWGSKTDLGAALRLLARVGTEDPDERLGFLDEAIGHLEQSPNRLELAKCHYHRGELFRVVRRKADARGELVLAAEIAAECGSTDVQLSANEALEAIGDRPRRFITIGADALTASERRVADLAVGGRSNRDIAHELFVSPKTVENHLGRIYTKLGINGRRELAGALG